jgi:hypothetical protein
MKPIVMVDYMRQREKRFWQVTYEGLPRLSRGEDTP